MSSSLIHPTACIYEGAQLHPSVKVGPYAIIKPTVSLGEGCEVGPYALVGSDVGRVTLGKRNKIFPRASIGLHPVQLNFDVTQDCQLVVGDDNTFHEQTYVHLGTTSVTRIGNGNYIGSHSHIGHDVTIGDGNIFVGKVIVFGHVQIGNNCRLAAKSAVAPFTRLGDYSFVSFNCVSSKKFLPVLPYGILKSAQQADSSYYVNTLGLKDLGFDLKVIAQINKIYRQIIPLLRKRDKEAALKILKSCNMKELDITIEFLNHLDDKALSLLEAY